MSPNEIVPAELLTRNSSNGVLLFTSFISIIISFAMIYLGKKGKQLWMVWGAYGLIIMALYMAGALISG
ncbi:MAG: hypothetical protein OEU84_14495 [Xanthomonadales bacterium]|nr:hypothetical protein [Xanthomonadales bacterium]